MSRKGLLICFTGIDGSGKTTQAKLLIDRLAAHGIKSMYTWSRGEVLAVRKVLLFVGRKALGTSTRELEHDQSSYRRYQSKKSKLMERRLVRSLWSVTTYAEHVLQINMDIRSRLRNGYWVVCDRYQWDTLIDLAALNNKSPEWLTSAFNMLMWRLLPKPAVTLFIDIPPEEAMRRKDDIPSLDYVQRRSKYYRYLASKEAWKTIDGCKSIEAIQGEINVITGTYMEREGAA